MNEVQFYAILTLLWFIVGNTAHSSAASSFAFGVGLLFGILGFVSAWRGK